jgi:HAMP domain-containing protein
MARRKRGWSWRAKLAVLLAVFTLVPLVAVTIYLLREQEQVARQQTLATLEGLAGAKAEALDQFADYRRRDAERMATLLAPFIVALAEAKASEPVLEEPPPERMPELEDAEDAPPEKGAKATDAPREKDEPTSPPAVADALTALRRGVALIAWDLEVYEEILVMDTDGRVIVSTFEAHEGHAGGELRYFEKGRNDTFLEPVFLSPVTGELTMVIATPIRDENHATIAVLAARLNLKRFFHLLGDSTGLGKSGEIVAGRVDGDHVLVVAPTRHMPDAALQLKLPLGGPRSQPLQDAARGQSGTGEAPDYRGVPTLVAWRFVPALEWGMVVKIDEAEALASVAEARRTAWAAGFVVIVFAVAGALLVARVFVRHLAELQEATEKISRGDFNVSLDIRSNDEIGELADSFERMIAAIKFFREHSRPVDEDSSEEMLASAPPEPAPDDERSP